MDINKWFRSAKGERTEDLTIDDLIALERYQEARAALEARLRQDRSDLHSRLRLAEVFKKLGQTREAFDEYMGVADAYAKDGFYDKAIALLGRTARLAPGNDKVTQKIEGLKMAKRLERRRDLVIDSLIERGEGEAAVGTTAFELQGLWNELVGSPLLERLSDDQLLNLFKAFSIERVGEGEQLAAAGERKEVIYLLGRGEIEVRVETRQGVETVLRGYSPGDLVGDRALLEHKPWPARYVASRNSTVLTLDREGLERILTGGDDPRRLLDALRAQRHDHEILDQLAAMKGRS